ncbi:ABC transporter ATP-binding protein [Luteococcus sp. Sow4_B9]|uniref:ABC transporter ATP-binding protein n=1 Tax=Luteococcus sp. Sow4_B9 TaxID=3438792 RepID=UPI003F979CB8
MDTAFDHSQPEARQLPGSTVPEPAPKPVLVGLGIVKTYGTTVALGGANLAIRSGESVAVMGPSGSGKTTLLHCLSGILAPDSGEILLDDAVSRVRVDGLDVEQRAQLRRERFGFVFQQGLLLPELTALENAALPLMLAGVGRREAEQQARGWLARLGLAGADERRLGQMSGGQVQRVAIARSQVTGAGVTFADEPTGALDQRTSAEVLEALLASTVGRGHTLVMVTHDEKVAARCARTVRLEDGQVVWDSNPLRPVLDGVA